MPARTELMQRLAGYRRRVASERDPVEREILLRAQEEEDEPAGGDETDDMPPPPPPPGDEELGGPPMDDLGDDLTPEDEGGGDRTLDDVLEGIDDLQEGIDELTDATQEVQEVLHEVHMDEADPDDVDRHVRDQKDEVTDDGEFTDEEMGVGPQMNSFFGGRGRGMAAGDLRSRRKALLAATTRRAQSDAKGQYTPDRHDVTLEDDHWAAPDQRDDLRSEALPADTFWNGTEIVDREDEHADDLPPVWKSVFQPTGAMKPKVQLSAQCVSADNQPPYWRVLNKTNRTVVAMIPRPKGMSVEAFTSQKFGLDLLGAIERKGVRTLQALRATAGTQPARPARATSASTSRKSTQLTAGTPEFEQAVERRVAQAIQDFEARFRRALDVTIQASNRNLITPNILKASLTAVMEEHDIEPRVAVPMVEQAFRMGASRHFGGIIAKAMEWMGKDDANFAEWEALVREASVVMPPLDGSRTDRGTEAAELRRRAAAGSFVPTHEGIGMGDDGDDRAQRLSAAVPRPASWYHMRGQQPPGQRNPVPGRR